MDVAGINRMPARAIPTRARLVALHPSEMAIRRLTEASSDLSRDSLPSALVHFYRDMHQFFMNA